MKAHNSMKIGIKSILRIVYSIFGIWILSTSLLAQITIVLKNEFIEKYKNRTTIDATFTIDKAHEKPNSPSKDGDLHIAGRAPEIKLPVVAEIMNAKFEDAAVDLVHERESTSRTVSLSGAWRIWCEHGGSSDHIQGKRLSKFETSNPDHVFELHPVTKLDDISVLASIKPIEGYTPKKAEAAFGAYENKRCQIKINEPDNTTTIMTSMGGYNYVEFIMELNGEPYNVADGKFVMASVLDLDEELIVRNRRMVFIKGTEAENALKGLKAGDRLYVLGMPRINLAIISWRTRNAAERPEVLTWNLPYEVIIVGVYK